MVALAVTAFVPPFLHRDRAAAVSEIAYMRLRAEGTAAFTIPPGIMQVTDIHAYGPYPQAVEGTVVYRSLFGLKVASVRAYGGRLWYESDLAAWWKMWAAFLLAESALGGRLCKAILANGEATPISRHDTPPAPTG